MARNNVLNLSDQDAAREYKEEKIIVFDGATANDPGDFDGTGNPTTLFTVTGDVRVRLVAKGLVDLEGASATIEVGTSGDTDALLGSETATDIDADGVITSDAGYVPGPGLSSNEYTIMGGQDIILTVGTANITAGSLKFYATFVPLSDDGDVVAA